MACCRLGRSLAIMGIGIVIDLAALLWLLARQVRTRPLKESYKIPIILGIIGLLEFGAFVMGGGQQLASFLKGQRSFATIPDGRTIVIAVAGSLVLAAVTGALRAPTVRLWRQDGQIWRKGTWVTVVLWIVSIGVHLGYDAVIAHGTGKADIGDATMLLFFAVSLTVQRWLLTARAHRIPELSYRTATRRPWGWLLAGRRMRAAASICRYMYARSADISMADLPPSEPAPKNLVRQGRRGIAGTAATATSHPSSAASGNVRPVPTTAHAWHDRPASRRMGCRRTPRRSAGGPLP
jgi:hypothetical protein